ncbi:hypothetical protein PENTCL1PPCAC_25612, partial [Pristionchus entomophagus]
YCVPSQIESLMPSMACNPLWRHLPSPSIGKYKWLSVAPFLLSPSIRLPEIAISFLHSLSKTQTIPQYAPFYHLIAMPRQSKTFRSIPFFTTSDPPINHVSIVSSHSRSLRSTRKSIRGRFHHQPHPLPSPTAIIPSSLDSTRPPLAPPPKIVSSQTLFVSTPCRPHPTCAVPLAERPSNPVSPSLITLNAPLPSTFHYLFQCYCNQQLNW